MKKYRELVEDGLCEGKELFAQSIHSASPRRHMPFIAQNCAAIPESILESLLFGSTRGNFNVSVKQFPTLKSRLYLRWIP